MLRSTIVSFIVYLISLLPFWLLYRVSDVIFFFLYYVFGYRREVVATNLANAFPEKTEHERKEIARKFYRFLPDLIVDAIKMRSISASQVRKKMLIVNGEIMTDYLQQHINVIGVSAHYGNWELAIHRVGLHLGTHPLLVIYKPLNNQTVNTIYNKIRMRFDAVMVPMKQTLRKIIQYKNTPHVSIFLADQTPMHNHSDYFINFLNQDTLVYTGPAKIAKLTNSPIVYCHIDRIKRGYYSCTFTTLVADPDTLTISEITDIHNQFTEDMIRRKPELWLWSHRRWKRQRTQ